MQGTMFPAGVWGGSPITPPRWIASQSICSPLLQTAAKRRKGAGNKFPAGVWGDAPSLPLDGLHRNPSALPFLQTAAKRSRESAEQASLKRSLSGTPPLFLSLDGLHRNPSLSPFFKPPRSEDGSLRDNRPSGGVWGGSPIVPYRPPSLDAYLSPFHHRCTRSARKRIKLPVRHVLDSVVRLYRTRRRRSRRRYAVAMRRRHAPA